MSQPPTTGDRVGDRARSFGAVADVYDRARPSYPAEALDWLLPAGARRVLDLGAGTGKLTRSLVARGLDVVAVEPAAGMREQFAKVLPGVEVLDGTGESIPLPDGSVDVVLMAQAWHWVDPATASPEVARVLRPGGRLGLLWNVRDAGVDWIAQLDRLLPGPGEEQLGSLAPRVGPPFGPVERYDVRWSDPVTVESLLDLTRSRSWVIALSPQRREEVLADVRAQARARLAATGSLELEYVTRCSRATLPGQPPGQPPG
ncbi:SAM-dependent methyltransferase [Kineococcus aurantiacus]|uniref:SAM-dependent methyltransferase n=2 Tax=Kineococcus aurantiacus TaxID=37633 RepID=A0A7Y9DN10_9ACTN|nr:class I SAM-dependent methyltransferase [Kineococcus aurantiacus]NYD23446.1 SAM-dependent methyltransferase [Kineococcus aurantiacus]